LLSLVQQIEGFTVIIQIVKVMGQIKNFVNKYKFQLIGFVIGAVGGYLYWYFVGCLSGTCPLKQLWYYNTIFGAAIGLLVGDTIKSYILKRKKNEKNEN
jgi:hypothetical protein